MNPIETETSEGRSRTDDRNAIDNTMFPTTGAAQTLAADKPSTDAGQPSMENVRQQAEDALEGAKQKGRELADKTLAMATEKQQVAAEQLNGLARALRTSAEQMDQEQAWMAQGVQRVAGVVEGLADTLREKDVKSLMSELNRYTRQQPAVVLGGATVAGFLLARFLKSSAQHRPDQEFRPTS